MAVFKDWRFCGGVLVYWLCGGGGVFVVLFCKISQRSTEKMDIMKDYYQISHKS